MDVKNIMITVAAVIVGVILASIISKKLGIGSWEESYDEE